MECYPGYYAAMSLTRMVIHSRSSTRANERVAAVISFRQLELPLGRKPGRFGHGCSGELTDGGAELNKRAAVRKERNNAPSELLRKGWKATN